MKHANISKEIDVTELWGKYGRSVDRKKRYLSYSDFQSLIFHLQSTEMLNIDYYVSLLQAIYEGIYSDDLSALTNLRGKDIQGNVVTVRCNGEEEFSLEISHDLSRNLLYLSELDAWERKNRSREFTVPIEGIYPDSCFKTENRNNIVDRDYKDCYYRYIRKVVNVAELDFPLRAKNLYISGIMHRVKEHLESKGMTLEQTFAFKRRWGDDVEIVRKELERVHYPYVYRDFTKLVSGYISDFQE